MKLITFKYYYSFSIFMLIYIQKEEINKKGLPKISLKNDLEESLLKQVKVVGVKSYLSLSLAQPF